LRQRVTETDLDTKTLESLKALLGDKFVELINTFITDCGARLTRMGTAIEASDFSAIRHEAHGIKGSSRNIGANGLAALSGEMEDKAKAEEGSDMAKLFTAIEQEFAAVAGILKSMIG